MLIRDREGSAEVIAWSPCVARVEHQAVLADLDLVAAGERRLVDPVPVDVGAVEAAHVADLEAVVGPDELGVPAGDRDVVEEDVAVRVPAGRGDVGESSRNRLPAFGPRWTTSRADPGGSASTAASSAVDSPSDLSAGSPGSNPPLIVMVEVSPGDGALVAGFRAAPQLQQKRASSALW